MHVIKLYFKDKNFIESVGKEIEGADAILQINEEEKEALLIFTRGASLIGKRMAQRQAENICRSGYILKSGERIAKGCRILVQQQDYQGERIFSPRSPLR